ncbi:hypothetical protein [Peribacillus sp. NPDC096540]|uniref:hypothetical protein n=1 Tax=Peribacillus sp. NPDC096540 TaxID=3390612 RepID=UPI003D05FCE6
MEIDDQIGFVDNIEIEEVDRDVRVEASYTGHPLYKTLEQIYHEKEFWEVPNVVVDYEVPTVQVRDFK